MKRKRRTAFGSGCCNRFLEFFCFVVEIICATECFIIAHNRLLQWIGAKILTYLQNKIAGMKIDRVGS